MRGHADLAEPGEDVLGDAIVEHALAFDQRVLLVVEGRGVILEVLDESAGLWSFVEHLGLALVYATPLVHSSHPRACVSFSWIGDRDECSPLKLQRVFLCCSAGRGLALRVGPWLDSSRT
jgi:hypothetical protein